jgi:superfamily I DNA/RNA helicase
MIPSVLSAQLIKEEILLRERSLLFVSATRAKKTLLITSYGERSSFIA